MKIIVGPGNPGQKYLLTRHNFGFMAVDSFSRYLNFSQVANKHKAEIFSGKVGSETIILVKPQTYMNNSGESIVSLLNFYDVTPEACDLLVIHDEVEHPFGSIKYQTNRGHGGHNGIRSISQLLGTKNYNRLRLGVSRPPNEKWSVADYLLSNFSKDEQSKIPDILHVVNQSLDEYIQSGFQLAATNYNQQIL